MPQGGDLKSAAPPLPTAEPASGSAARRQDALLGTVFVVLWSTGYPAARIALDHAAPFTVLVLRFGGAALIFAALAWISRAPWPRGRAMLPSALVGSLQLALQFGALYWAVARGVNVGLIALVIGTMPIVVALLGLAFLREAVRPLQWLGFALGFAGVALAVGESITPSRAGAGPGLAVLAGLFAISVGTLYQKRQASDVDARSGLALQNLAATLLLLPLAADEGFRIDGSTPVIASLAWMIVVNSLTAFALFFVLLRRGAVNQVATLFFLMPPVTAVLDFLVLGDRLTGYKLAGLAFAALGVYLATRPAVTPDRNPRPAQVRRPPAAHRPRPAPCK